MRINDIFYIITSGQNLPPSCAVVTKSGNLNFLEPSGPLQVCNGTALLLARSNNVKHTTNPNNIY